MAEPDFNALSERLLELCNQYLDLMPDEALVTLMTAAARIIGASADTGLEGYTKEKALEHFGALIDQAVMARQIEETTGGPTAGTA